MSVDDERHALTVCNDFLRDGYWAECSCGWRSELLESAEEAQRAYWREHP